MKLTFNISDPARVSGIEAECAKYNKRNSDTKDFQPLSIEEFVVKTWDEITGAWAEQNPMLVIYTDDPKQVGQTFTDKDNRTVTVISKDV